MRAYPWSVVIAASLVPLLAGVPAQAQNGTLTRSFVSSAGVDTNACTIAAPCASFAHAYTMVGANGIIAALDPGKYGPLTIAGPVTVNGNGWAAITALASGNGVTINAVSGNVILTGLEVDGAGAAYNGIVFNSGTSLTISDCIVKDFIVNIMGDTPGGTGNGIWIAPTSGTMNFTIVNTVALDNQNAGINYEQPSGNAAATGSIDHVVANNNPGSGIQVIFENGTGSTAAVNISNSIASNNGSDGISVFGSAYTVTIDKDQVSNNSNIGVANEHATILLSRSVITNNSNYGIVNGGGTVDSFQDNRIYGNGHSNNPLGTISDVATQ